MFTLSKAGRWLNLLVAGITAILASSCVFPAPTLQRYEFQQPQMGLPFRMVLYAKTRAQAEAASNRAFARIQQLNDVMSDYEFDSELSTLSRSSGEGRARPVSQDLWIVLSRSQRLAQESSGAFDITVGPYTALWRKARREKQLPTAEKLKEFGAGVGYQKLVLDPRKRTAVLTAPRMRLDLGGIAKGYAIDEALKVLRSNGISRALVTGGGDMAAAEPPPGQPGWRIELAALDATLAPAARFILLKNRALATSGDLFQHVEIEGKRYSHIVDPRTGLGLTDHSLVNVIARDCMTADSLTKVVSILGPEAGFEFIRRKPGVSARVTRKPEAAVEVSETPGFARYYFGETGELKLDTGKSNQ